MKMISRVLAFVLLPFFSLAQNYNMELLGHLPYDVELSDVWGYVDEEGNEYALVGLNDNFSIVDVTDPVNPDEVFRTIGGNSSAWRDIKTYSDYAYITCECFPGLMIVDMSPLPDTTSLTYTNWVHDSVQFYQAHNLFIDENGIAYIFGAFYSRGGAVMLDLKTDPMDPEFVGLFDVNYLHDGVVRGDTLWGSAVNLGQLQVIDVSDKSDPEIISLWTTPSSFTHNAWFSDDNRYIFTTDEVRNGSIAAYDALNIFNPIELDIWMVDDTSIIPHNTHFLDDYLITSHYTYGINILDVKRPKNMIESGRYDTSPDYRYEGFNGCWGAYPYLPSGNILATDIEEGLYVFKPTYQRGCYLEGAVTDLHTGSQIFFPTIEILGTNISDQGNIVGDYAISTLDAGTYSVVASADGYFSDTVENVSLNNGVLTLQYFQLSNWPVGINTVSKDQISIFPNPTNDFIQVENTDGCTYLEISNSLGEIVYSQSINSNKSRFKIDLASGVYSISIYGEKETWQEQIVIQK